MDLVELGDMGSGCEDENCGLAEDCLDQDCHWEEPMFGLIELVCVTVIYILLMLSGLLGNILTILVVWLRPHMRSTTYLYLSSMAVSDLLILLLLPLDLYKLWRPRPWPLGDLACKVTMFLSECCTFCTILHITFLSLERYLAVCWPITAKTLVTRRRTRALIGCLWLGAAVSAAPVLVMVGVEEVGGEELAFGGWREDGGWTGGEGELGGFTIGGGERGSGHVASMNGGQEGINWEDKEKKRRGERVGELKWFEENGERKVGIEERDERKQEDGGKVKPAGGGGGEGESEVEGEQQKKKKEDEGGGREEGIDGSSRGEIDNRECRCTHYAVSSGLLSAMMILSNLYFLVPLCILGLVYSLIGRTLWLRPQSSRRDQSHRHIVKMLGVIVLAFVLCWLPFHVGRTIFSLSLDTGSDRQEAHTDINSTLSDFSVHSDINAHALTEPVSRSDSDTRSKTGKMTACAHTEREEEVKINTDVDAHWGRVTDNGDTNNRMHENTTRHARSSFRTDTGGNTHTQNRTLICINSQNNTPNHTPPIAHVHDLYADSAYNDTRFNGTDKHPDTHLYFLYYLSQYFNLVSSVLFYLSAAINPLLYNLMSARYRHAVHSIIHAHAHSPRLRTLTTRHSTTTL